MDRRKNFHRWLRSIHAFPHFHISSLPAIQHLSLVSLPIVAIALLYENTPSSAQQPQTASKNRLNCIPSSTLSHVFSSGLSATFSMSGFVVRSRNKYVDGCYFWHKSLWRAGSRLTTPDSTRLHYSTILRSSGLHVDIGSAIRRYQILEQPNIRIVELRLLSFSPRHGFIPSLLVLFQSTVQESSFHYTHLCRRSNRPSP